MRAWLISAITHEESNRKPTCVLETNSCPKVVNKISKLVNLWLFAIFPPNDISCHLRQIYNKFGCESFLFDGIYGKTAVARKFKL